MTIETILILSVGLTLGLIIGYLFSVLHSRKKIVEAELNLQNTQTQVTQLQQEAASTKEELNKVDAKYRAIEIQQATLTAQQESATKLNTFLRTEFEEARKELEQTMLARHESDKARRGAETTIQENQKTLDAINLRLKQVQAEAASERARYEEQVQKSTQLETQAKEAQIIAQEVGAKYQEQIQRLEAAQADALRERLRYEEQAQKSAQLETQTKEAQVLAQEVTSKYQETKQALDALQTRFNTLQDNAATISNDNSSLKASLEERNQSHAQQKQQIDELNQKIDELHRSLTTVTKEHADLKISLEERDKGHAHQLAQFEEQKKALSEQFKLLANDILETKVASLQESNKLSLTAVMSPFQQSMDVFKREVQEIHHRETTQQGELKKELESLKELNQKITTEAHELSTALRGQKKLQGNWGELILENVLDRSGLVMGKDFKREVSITTEDGRQRPDVVVYLPQNKHLIIDAKVSLNAYTSYVNSTDDAERAQALSEHVKAIGQRITELADRDYYKLPGLNSPEIVFMFIPIESAFVEALKADETLFQKAIERNVLVATPTTLLTSLNIVRQLWRYEDQNKHTALLANKAENVFKKLNTFLDSFEGIKKGLEKANDAYTKAENQLISGKGNLVKQVGDFKNLAPAIKAELPSYFTDKATLEIDYIPADQQLPNTEASIPNGLIFDVQDINANHAEQSSNTHDSLEEAN
jgi:DNA recombination protein RmuC